MAMQDVLEVYIDYMSETYFVGRCFYTWRSNTHSSVFKYDPSWLDQQNAFAIDPENLPLSSAQLYFSKLPGAIEDAGPDRWGQKLIERKYRKAGETRSLSPVDYILGLNDETRIGALRFKRPSEKSFDPEGATYKVPPLINLPTLLNATIAIENNTETAEDLKYLLNEGSPLGGARPKCAIKDKDGTFAIAKFPSQKDDYSKTHAEVLLMKLAKKVGLRVAPARTEKCNDKHVAIITRFDRQMDNQHQQHKRIPFISAMTILGAVDGAAATYVDIAEAVRKHSIDPKTDLRELFARVSFNILTSNFDDHLRNHGFVYADKGMWRLSPAYDLNPTPDYEKARELTTWISSKGPNADLDHLREMSPYFGLNDQEEVDEIIARQKEELSGWHIEAQRLGMTCFDIEAISSAFKLIDQ